MCLAIPGSETIRNDWRTLQNHQQQRPTPQRVTGNRIPVDCASNLRPKVEAKDAAVGEEEVVEGDEERLAYDRVDGPQRLRDLRAAARRSSAHHQPREQRGGELPRRAQLG